MAARKTPGNQWSVKAWRDAIRVAALRPFGEQAKPKTKLDAAATALIDAGVAGDVPALKEIGDRLDGRVPQAITAPEGTSGGSLTVTWLPAQS